METFCLVASVVKNKLVNPGLSLNIFQWVVHLIGFALLKNIKRKWFKKKERNALFQHV